MPLPTPSDLVRALEQRHPAARQQVRDRYRRKLERLIDQLVEPHYDPARLADHTLRSVEMWLVSQGATAFSQNSWRSFDARVLLYGWRILTTVEPCTVTLPEPSGDAPVGPFSVRSFTQPLQAVGGDWWTCEPKNDGTLLAFVSDVTGHGRSAYLLATGLPHLFKMCSERCSTSHWKPSAILAEMDRELEGVLPEGVFVEATMAQFIVQSKGVARLCAAGYAAALLRSNSVRLLPLGGMYLGLTSGIARTESELDFDSGDELLMATDGLWDQSCADTTGEPRLREYLPEVLKDLSQTDSMHDAVIECLKQAIQKSGKQQDDVCVVTVRHSGTAEDRP
jgi:hypothetical protein